MKKTILVAGATGSLGNKICSELIKRGADVRAIVRMATDFEKIETLKNLGIEVIEIDLTDHDEIVNVCANIDCVVSALAGLGDVIIDLQKRLLDGALQAGVPRFIPSDFCTDYNDLLPGENRNFDLRRQFKMYLDSSSIQASSIFNGAFADILKYNTPILNLKDKSIGYWGEKADWKLDFTTMDNTAAFTAEVALDDNAPRNLQIASFQVSPNMIWADVKVATDQEFRMQELSSLEDFAQIIKKQRADNPAGEAELYAKWQQAQYMYSMFSTHHYQLFNQRYKNIDWTTGLDYISSFVK
ncbi:SDR family NAD(P)-dependent oxidoreductase [Pedobacter frigidisoli]|uniref:SDR family NAD(P)-dependent oxidoreductase n=1 Tax=Pedobacter frigidisoli TaxID=2530455 RepID=A0A4R0NYN4_9SPHI|nr:SDR family NAD(P)-dependent oxidoreductase [Pedobacter frigidisoli]TCD05589.1 SDR family NAD(P)-dependent oxidoreductase [Pedobacter frigidisoli]